MNKQDAAALAERINRHWARQGWDAGAHVTVHTVELTESQFSSTYGVRTPGRVNGLPKRALSTQKVA